MTKCLPYWLKSALIFSIILASNGCDKFNRTTPTAPHSNPSVAEQSPSLNYDREKLTRGIEPNAVLSPWFVTEAGQTSLIRDLFEGLTAYDAQGNLVPAAAESWQTEDNRN